MPPYVNVKEPYDTVPCAFLAANIKYNFRVGQVNPIFTLTACSSHTISTSESCWLHTFIACEFEVALHSVVKRYEAVLPSSPLAVCLSVGLDYY
jgi:hypothetical protein